MMNSINVNAIRSCLLANSPSLMSMPPYDRSYKINVQIATINIKIEISAITLAKGEAISFPVAINRITATPIQVKQTTSFLPIILPHKQETSFQAIIPATKHLVMVETTQIRVATSSIIIVQLRHYQHPIPIPLPTTTLIPIPVIRIPSIPPILMVIVPAITYSPIQVAHKTHLQMQTPTIFLPTQTIIIKINQIVSAITATTIMALLIPLSITTFSTPIIIEIQQILMRHLTIPILQLTYSTTFLTLSQRP